MSREWTKFSDKYPYFDQWVEVATHNGAYPGPVLWDTTNNERIPKIWSHWRPWEVLDLPKRPLPDPPRGYYIRDLHGYDSVTIFADGYHDPLSPSHQCWVVSKTDGIRVCGSSCGWVPSEVLHWVMKYFEEVAS